MFSNPKKNLEQFDIIAGMKVADFGSGAGHYTLPVAQAVGPSGRVYAFDIHKELLVTLKNEAEKSHLLNVEIVQADFEKPKGSKLKDNAIERGLVVNVLFQIDNKPEFVREVARVIKPGGKILVIDWEDSFGGIGPDKKAVFPGDKCRALFEQNGFSFEKKISAGLHHYGFVFKKV